MARRLHYFFKIGIKFTYRETHRSLFYFLAAVGPCYCTWAFSSCSERGLLFIMLCGLLIAAASLVPAQRLKLLQPLGSLVWLVRSRAHAQ